MLAYFFIGMVFVGLLALDRRMNPHRYDPARNRKRQTDNGAPTGDSTAGTSFWPSDWGSWGSGGGSDCSVGGGDSCGGGGDGGGGGGGGD